MGYLELPSFLANSSVLFLITYTGAGIAVFVALCRSFQKANFPPPLRGHRASIEGLILLWLFWPIAALLSLFEYRHLTRQRKIRREQELAKKSQGKYASMTMDELVAEQRKVLDSFNSPRE